VEATSFCIMAAGTKRVYGLVLPKRATPAVARAPIPAQSALFGLDDDVDGPSALISAPPARAEQTTAAEKEVPGSVYDYDSWKAGADEAALQAREQRKSARVQGVQRESRYIATLLAKAEDRKRERDAVFDRLQAKELADEEEAAGTSERFVTPAYATVLEQRAAAEAREAERAAKEVHVGSSGSMSDFYRNLMTKNVSFGAVTSVSSTGKRARHDHEVSQPPKDIPPPSSVSTAAASEPSVATAPGPGPVIAGDGAVGGEGGRHELAPALDISSSGGVRLERVDAAALPSAPPSTTAQKPAKLSVDAIAAAKAAALARLQAKQLHASAC
jgi:hypothetical protein